MPGTDTGLVLKSWQPQVIFWMVLQCESLTCGGILADYMGLGKTIQTLCFIAYKNEKRWEIEGWGGNKPTLVLVPPAVAFQWYQAVSRFLGKRYRPFFYTAENYDMPVLTRKFVQDKMDRFSIVMGSYTNIVTHNGPAAIQKWQARNPDLPNDQCPVNLCGLFSVMVLDEAHIVKHPTAQRSQTAANIRAHKTIFLTGTPVANRASDLEGLLAILPTKDLWDKLRVEANFNPFEVDDEDPRSALRATLTAFDRFVRPLDARPRKQAVLLKQLYSKILLRRTYATKIQGEPVGYDIPVQVTRRMDIQVSSELQGRLNRIIDEQKKGLITAQRDDSGEVVYRMDGAKARNLVQATT
jgi:SNF2 family DNA or RNA helicase